MFYTLSKIFWLIVKPLNFIGLLAALVAILWVAGARKTGKGLAGIALVLFLVFGLVPVGSFGLKKLENAYERPAIQDLGEDIDGIILLGGMLDFKRSASHDHPIYNAWANRLFDFIALHHEFPEARAVISGGAGGLFSGPGQPADFIKRSLEGLEVDPEQIIFETRSRNTYENAVYTRAKIKPEPGQKWVLVTSAFHMRRAVSVFCAAGWPVIPYPTGHITLDQDNQFSPIPDILEEYVNLDIALKEGIGIIAYWMFDRLPHLKKPIVQPRKDNHVQPVKCHTL